MPRRFEQGCAVDALQLTDSSTRRIEKKPHHLHCNVFGTYYIHNGSGWVAYVMEAGLDYFDVNVYGISSTSTGSADVNAGEITVVL